MSEKIDFKPKQIQSVRETHLILILIKGKINSEDIHNLNMYTSNTRAPEFIKEALLQFKSRIYCNTLRVSYLHMPLSPINRSSGEKLTEKSWS